MAKGKIKSLVSPWCDVSITRNGEQLILTPVDLERGDGKYLGLAASVLDKCNVTVDRLITWTSKNQETATSPLATSLFINKLGDAFNSLVFRNAWRESVELLGETKVESLTDAQKATAIETFKTLVERYFSEDSSREGKRDASYYRRKAAEVTKNMLPLNKKAAGKIANLTPEELAKYKSLRVERDGFIALAEQKEREEMAALESSLDDTLDSELDAIEETPNPIG